MNKKSVVYNSFLTVVRQLVGIALGLISAMIIARTLGVEGQGKYALIILLPNVLYTIFNMGIAPASVYYIGKKKFALENVFKMNLLLAFTLSLVTIIVGLLFIVFFHEQFYKSVPLKAMYMLSLIHI